MYGKFLVGIILSACVSSAAHAQPLDPEAIPPDVTIPYVMPTGASAPTQTATPAGNPVATPAHTLPANQTPGLGLDQSGLPAAKHRGALGQSAYPGLAGKNSAPPGTPFSNQVPGSNYVNLSASPNGAPQLQVNDDPNCPGCVKHQSIQTPPNLGGAVAPATTNTQGDPVAIIQTTKGPITIRLFKEHAPRTVANFMDLVQKGFYNGIVWHRVVQGFCIQAGCPKGDGSGGFIDPATNQERRIALELSPRLRHNAPGVVAMARFGNDMNSASSQFYITQSAQPHLDTKYSIFGGVVSGMNTVMQMTTQDRILGITLQ